ncbi:fibronectin type III domain-containing protein [uncultured Alistipes sp.]|uniref:fibronectin type III domain-containing protein n=1 Tax=uncultured Alistipes sp. TaxID=538949 RepID=UPI00261C831D|nr:fibronectin type III domain-containing protein [uncultured Alistipes sp.]
MQNKLFTLLCTALLAFALTSCEKDESTDPSKLPAPVLNVTEQLSDGFTVSWQAVENATGYNYVFGSEAEKSTTATSVSFTGLEPGTYTVKVKAVSGSAEWSDSDYATISATLEDEPSSDVGLTFTIEVSDITATTATLKCTPSDNSKTYYFDCMEKEQFDQLHTSDEAFATALLEGMEYMGAAYGMTLEEVLGLLLSTGPDSWTAESLAASTEHVVYALGINMDGTVTSAVATKNFTTEERAGGSDDEGWFGNWSATSTGSLKWDVSGQYLEPTYEETRAMDLNFTIKEENGQILLYGWSQVDSEIPALCEINDNGDLEVYAGVTVGSASGGYTPTWSGYSIVNGSDYSLITGTYPAYTFSMNGDQATCKRYEGELSGGGTFETISLEVYALSDTQYAIYGSSFPVYHVAGDVTMTKAAGSSAMKAAAAMKAAQKYSAKVLCPSSYVLNNMQAAK